MTPTKRVKIHGRRSHEIVPFVRGLGLEIVDENPEVVVSYGGDGTLLAAEKLWPGVPKVALRDSERCRTCSNESNELILRHLAEDRLKRCEFLKLQATAAGRTLGGLNNIILRNANLTAGVRFIVRIDGDLYGEGQIVGDGLVVSTPFGSSAYYRSITHSTFRVGIGLAFNNTIEPINHLVLSEESEIRIRVTRGPALLAGDQLPDQIDLDRDDEVLIRKAEQNAVILAYDHVKYPAHQFIYHDGDDRSR
ncbi:NAD(+)/NADH kinase [Candidatus Sumerlaeota bacterium]|nr:NAD(+)/NADH kinase [Candidatus Sumerlaeota bacterium]